MILAVLCFLFWLCQFIQEYNKKVPKEAEEISLHPTPDRTTADASDCGPASLATILAFFGKEVSLKRVCEVIELSEREGSIGCSALDIKHAAAFFGLECIAYYRVCTDSI